MEWHPWRLGSERCRMDLGWINDRVAMEQRWSYDGAVMELWCGEEVIITREASLLGAIEVKIASMIFRCWHQRSFVVGISDLSLLASMIFRCWHQWSFVVGIKDLSLLASVIFRCWHQRSFVVDISDLSLLASKIFRCWHQWSFVVGINDLLLLTSMIFRC